MRVHVHLKEKVVTVQCAEGTQLLRWLGHVAILRYDTSGTMELAVPGSFRTQNGAVLDLDSCVKDVLEDDQHIWMQILP